MGCTGNTRLHFRARPVPERGGRHQGHRGGRKRFRAPTDRKILHATFRRSGRVDAEQGFDIDYYDLHWLPRQLVLNNDGVWRTDLLGGGRALGFVDRLKKFRTIGKFAESQKWDFGEGFIEGGKDISRP